MELAEKSGADTDSLFYLPVITFILNYILCCIQFEENRKLNNNIRETVTDN